MERFNRTLADRLFSYQYHKELEDASKSNREKKQMLSPYCESITEKFNISISQVHKLIPTLNKKGMYVLHYRN